MATASDFSIIPTISNPAATPVNTSETKSLSRPPLANRNSSGTIIVPSDSANVETRAEQYDADDARAMSPRRNSDEVTKMGDDARQALEESVPLPFLPITSTRKKG